MHLPIDREHLRAVLLMDAMDVTGICLGSTLGLEHTPLLRQVDHAVVLSLAVVEQLGEPREELQRLLRSRRVIRL